jgi:hypothetical protein
MPDWSVTKVTAARHVLEAMINDEGDVDFARIIPMEAEWPWDSFSGRAEELAKAVISARGEFVGSTDNDSFEQFIQMLRNYRKCGSLHYRDFAISHWGTKWNAADSVVELDAGSVSFATAWYCPLPVLLALSNRFPDEAIDVMSDDEDLEFAPLYQESDEDEGDDDYIEFRILGGRISAVDQDV